jgi:hypothetical protein
VTRPAHAALREEFVRALTVDSETRDRRRRDYNQAIFAPQERGGYAIFTGTDLSMVLDAFDAAVRRATANPESGAAS